MSCVRERSRGMPEVPEAEEGRARGPESVGEPPGGRGSHGARMGEPGAVASRVTPGGSPAGASGRSETSQ